MLMKRTIIAIGFYVVAWLIGFSVGDELGFAESLGNLEGSKRRSLSQRDSVLNNNIGVLPASRMPPPQQMSIKQNRPKAVVAWQPPPPPPLPFSSRLLQVDPRPPQKLTMTEAVSLPLGVPAFRPIPTVPPPSPPNHDTFNHKMNIQYPHNVQLSNLTYIQPQMMNSPSGIQKIQPINKDVPVFHAMPSSVSRISTAPDGTSDFLNRNSVYHTTKIDGLRSKVPSLSESLASGQIKLPQIDLMGHTVEELAVIANVSVDAIQRAIQLKQQQLLIEQQAKLYQEHMEMIRTSTTTTTTAPSTLPPTPPPTRPSTTAATILIPTKRHTMAGGNKVMNAPKEYYPVGYEKNFDDNFISKVDLPATSFYCGDQKHFPGLYADMDLGCMVFHVCALTDDGLIMKSFLCPESTLFDQTVLKCNWWFYVDCKNSKGLYDSNLPVSKSYQLMKALTFFSKYKNSQNEKGGVDVEALQNSVAASKTT